MTDAPGQDGRRHAGEQEDPEAAEGAVEARLLAELGPALGPDPLPPGLVERAEGLLPFLDLDRELAELLSTAADEPVGARGAPTDRDALVFRTPDGAVEVELTFEGDRVIGQVLAGTPELVTLERLDGTTDAVAPDELGTFVVEPGSAHSQARSQARPRVLRLVLQVGADQPVRTDWFHL